MQEQNYLDRLFSLELLVFGIIYLYLLGRGPGMTFNVQKGPKTLLFYY